MSDVELDEIAQAMKSQAMAFTRLANAMEKIAEIYVARYEGDGESRR